MSLLALLRRHWAALSTPRSSEVSASSSGHRNDSKIDGTSKSSDLSHSWKKYLLSTPYHAPSQVSGTWCGKDRGGPVSRELIFWQKDSNAPKE